MHLNRTSKSLSMLASVSLVLLLLICGVGVDPVLGAEPIKIACSAQAYDILKGEPLEIVKQKTQLSIELEITNSAEAMNRVYYGLNELAISAERADYRLTSNGFKEYPFCKDALIVVTNNRSRIKEMTHDQVRQVFAKQITNANAVGGSDMKLVVVAPADTTALYKNFKQMFMGEDKIAYDVMATQSTYVNSFARRIEGAVTFVNQRATESEKGRPLGTNLVKIDGLGPDDARYPYQETFYLMLKEDASPDVKKVMEAFFSDEFCKALRSKCVSPVEKGKDS